MNDTKLSADNIGIILIKCIVTDCAPGIVDADLHSTLQWIVTSHQSQCTIITITSRSGGVWACESIKQHNILKLKSE